MDFYDLLYKALTTDDITIKEDVVLKALAYCNENEVREKEEFKPVVFDTPSYAQKCQIVHPRKLPARKDFESKEGLATLLHAITHIEYSAIDLALDAVYRFYDMPLDFKKDWLVVAQDEVRHFKMLHEMLEDLGYEYGDFVVHSGLFDVSMHTVSSVLDRMAIVPRYYEASGLDVNPQIIKKLDNKRKNPRIAKVIDALQVIYEEEIEHVYKGDKWFKYLCQEQGLDEDVYFEILQKYELLNKHRPHINVEARKEAGFTCDEIKKLGAKECS